ncbi:replicase, partial [Helicobacter pylori]|nr:replicase [Helicobacter pylori]
SVYNGDFAAPLDGKEVWWIAKSVAKWTWRNFTPEKFAALVKRTHTSEIQRNRRISDGRKRLIEEVDAQG